MAAVSTVGAASSVMVTQTADGVLTQGDVSTALLLGGAATATSVVSGVLGARIH